MSGRAKRARGKRAESDGEEDDKPQLDEAEEEDENEVDQWGPDLVGDEEGEFVLCATGDWWFDQRAMQIEGGWKR